LGALTTIWFMASSSGLRGAFEALVEFAFDRAEHAVTDFQVGDRHLG